MPRHGSRAGKGSKSSKTARVLGLIADPSAAREEHGSPAESPSQQRLDDRAAQADIHDALEQELLAEEESRRAAASPAPAGHQATLSRQGAGSRRAVSRAPAGDDAPAQETVPVRARPGRRTAVPSPAPEAVPAPAPAEETAAPVRRPPRRTPPRSQETAPVVPQAAPAVPEEAPVVETPPVREAAPVVPQTAPVVPGDPSVVETPPARSAIQRAAIRAGAVSDDDLAMMEILDGTASPQTPPARTEAPQSAPPARTAAPAPQTAPSAPQTPPTRTAQTAAPSPQAHVAAVRADEAVRRHKEPIAEKDPEEFVCYNLTRALVEAQAEKYMRSYGMCMCGRCRVDVEAIALSNLPSKYVAAQNMDLVPLLSMYEKKESAEVTAKVMNACQLVKARPHHGR